jgi:outer membrane protein OmpA-like peptidoglycan-associated protein
VQIAEDLIAEGQALAERCDPPPPPPAPPAPPQVVPPPPPPPAPPAPPPVVVPVQLGANVVFNFDHHTAADMRDFSVAELRTLVAQVKAKGLVVQQLQLIGHADRLNGTGHSDYNQRLSERRAATVREALVKLGLPGIETAQVQVQAVGDGKQVQSCSGRFASKAELQECLLPNRRVELVVSALPAKP